MAVFEGALLRGCAVDHRALSAGPRALGRDAPALPGAVGRGAGHARWSARGRGLLGLTTAEVEAVATFYTMYRLRPTGEHLVNVCTNLACMLRGAKDVYEAAHEAAGMAHGQEVSDDGLITLHEEECLGVCDFAPAVQIDFANHDNVTPDRMRELDRAAPRRRGADARPRHQGGELPARVARARGRRARRGGAGVSLDFERRLTRDWDDPSVIGLVGYRGEGRIRGAAPCPRDAGRRPDPAGEGLRTPRPGRRRVPDGDEVVASCRRTPASPPTSP